jgi:hypothetical protein
MARCTWLAVLAGLLGGCSAAPSPPLPVVQLASSAPSAPVAPAAQPLVATAQPNVAAPPYSGLFQKGRVYVLAFETRQSGLDATGRGPTVTTGRGTFTCGVTEVRAIGDARAAWVQCDGVPDVPVDRAAPGGGYLATAQGLWRVDALPASAGDLNGLTADTMLLAASPTPGKREQPLAGAQGFVRWHEVSAFRDGFCATEASAAGDEGGYTLCFSHEAGLVGGSAYFAGGFTRDLWYGEVPREP